VLDSVILQTRKHDFQIEVPIKMGVAEPRDFAHGTEGRAAGDG